LYRDIPEEMRALIEPIVDDFGLELVDVERRQGRAPWQVRVVVDTREGDGRVPIDTCAEVSREVGAGLDAADAIPVSYRLEVSSPGLDRVLAREKDFARAVGRDVRLETRAPVEGRRRFRGRLVGFDGACARLDVDGREVTIPFEAVRRANAVYVFSRDDFAAGGRR
jgi:ribosome maturation factor RimP